MWEYLIGLFALLRALTGIRFFLIKRRVNNSVPIMKEAQPFFKKVSGKKVVLLIHGFTSSPREFRDLSEYFATKGISSYAPLLPGHGTSPERLSLIKHYQWIESVGESIGLLTKEYDEIYIVGSSFGGNLALICSNYSNKVKGVISLTTPIFFRKHKFNQYLILPVLKRIKLFQKKPKKVRKFIETHKGSYKVIPLKAAYEMSKIVDLSKKNLNEVTKPLLIVYVENDSVVSEESYKYILDNILSKIKIKFEIPESNHVVLLGKYADRVNDKIFDFIKDC